MTIEENLFALRNSLDKANKDTQIVAATKTRTIEEIRVCMATGLCIAAGENRVQELTEKYVPDFRWDFIGQLQTNKVKFVVGKATLIHSLDRLVLAEAIEKEGCKKDIVQDCLLEINTGKEEQKGGIFLEETENFLEKISSFSHIRVRGLMAVAPIDAEEKELFTLFGAVEKKFSSLKNGTFDILSMGMSNDCLVAATCGATLVRVGRRIFGERNPVR